MAAGEAEVGAIRVRELETLEEWELAVELQRAIWRFSPEDQVPARLFGVFRRIGGATLGAYVGGELVGFALAFAGFKASGERYWHSHMVGVRPSLHGRGIGHRLKLEQREAALAAGVSRIEWTFDPLRARNAHFNVRKLGVEARRYLPDFYGTTSSDLHGGLPTDRLVAVWHLRSQRVADRGRGIRAPVGASAAQIQIPSSLGRLSRAEASALQRRVRSEFRATFARGLRVTDFTRGTATGTYHLNP